MQPAGCVQLFVASLVKRCQRRGAGLRLSSARTTGTVERATNVCYVIATETAAEVLVELGPIEVAVEELLGLRHDRQVAFVSNAALIR